MATLTYTDLLDTVRPPEDDGLALAALKCSLLLGGRPILTTSQAFDLRLLLHEAASVEGLPILDLFRQGHIQVRWWRENTIRQAFSAALRREDFEFSAWPEVHDSVEGTDIRRALLETIDDSNSDRLPQGVRQRMLALMELDDAERSHSPNEGKKALTPGATLADNLCAILRHQGNAPERYRPLLQQLLAIKTRSDGYRIIRGVNAPDEVKRGVRELLDVCYNRVMAQSVGATEAMLTVSNVELQGVMDDALSDHRAPISLRQFVDRDLSKVPLQVVEWSKIKDFLNGAQAASKTEWVRELQLKNLLTVTAYDKGRSLYSLLSRNAGGAVALTLVAIGGLIEKLPLMAAGFLTGAIAVNGYFPFLSPYLSRWADSRVKKRVEGWVDRHPLLPR